MVEAGSKETESRKKAKGPGTGSALWTDRMSSLLGKGVFFFTLTLLLTLLLTAVVFYELAIGSIESQAAAGATKSGIAAWGGDNFNGLKSSLFLLTPLVVLFVTLVGGMIFFIHYIARPLDDIGKTARRIADGRLDKPVQVKTRDEIGQLGECINDAAINMQEVLLTFWNHTQRNIMLVDRLEKRIQADSARDSMLSLMEEDFSQLKQNDNDMKSLILTYDFLDIKLDKEKMLIKS